jgi:NAD(P)-dependent dehydrogenase (short-subunit alcohol dehydrogenase family)
MNIVITGCSTGFGFSAAKYFADKGHKVWATMRGTKGKNKNAAEALNSYSPSGAGSVSVLDLDVVSDDSVQNAIAHIEKEDGVVDVLINNAGVGYGGAIESLTSKDIMQQLDINLVGCFRVAKAVLPMMRRNKSGLIIQLSSIAGRSAFPGFGAYHASKWGLEGLSEAMRYELAPLGIDVVIVEPGPFATNFITNIVPSTDEEIAKSYAHVGAFVDGFVSQLSEMFEDANAPTDLMMVVEAMGALVDMPVGSRPLRTIVGLDFGTQAVNDATEPLRKAALEGLGLADMDGPRG